MQDLSRFSGGDWFLLTALIIGACICLFAALRLFHRARLIEDMPTSKIRSCPQGYVELHGTAKWMDGPEIHAPLSGLPCVWYAFSVEEYVQRSKQKWRHIDSGVSDHLFLLEDDTGSCVIDPEGAEVTPSSTSTWYGSKRVNINLSSSQTSTLKILSDVLMQSGQRYRYTERRVDQYESIYAIGEYSSMGTGYQASLKDAASAHLRDLKRDKEKLAEYDKNNDGQIDIEEWEIARQDAKRAVLAQQLSNPLPKRTHVLKKPQTKKYQPYLLSSKTETHMSRKNRIYSAGLAFLFVVFITSIFLKIIGKF
ncbi:MAG: GIDE domain-containing protein [Gammaproteobacteria bacterium]